MKSHQEQVKYLTESIPELRNADNRRRKVLLTLLYWKIFDGIDLPSEITQQILQQGTNPETIMRALRHVNQLLNTDEKEGEKNVNIDNNGLESKSTEIEP